MASMKNFAVYAKVELIQKPDWLDGFRSKYDTPYEYHVTLKQSCLINADQAGDIKARLATLFSSSNNLKPEIKITFDSLKIRKDEGTGETLIMINATESGEINNLQKSIVEALGEYKNYRKEKYKNFEDKFVPHITIARALDEKSSLEASRELKEDYACVGLVKEIVLVVTENPTAEEANNPNNRTIYKLNSI